MAKWDLRPAGISRTLKDTADVAKGLEHQAKSYGGHLESAASSAGTLSMGGEGGGGQGGQGQSGLVGAALAEFAQKTKPDLEFIAARAGKSIEGAGKATSEYLSGDHEMAARTQHAALGAPDPPPGQPGGGK
jgi:hypothetical protein